MSSIILRALARAFDRLLWPRFVIARQWRRVSIATLLLATLSTFLSTSHAQSATGIEPGFEFNLRGPGQYYDKESGLVYNGARYYNPSHGGRFTRADPSGLQAGFGRYEYLRNNPTGFIDPEGLAPRPPYPQAPQPYTVSPTGGGGRARPLVQGTPVQRLDAPIPFCAPGAPPPNLSPEGAGRRGALNAVKRAWDIPMHQAPASVGPNIDNRGNVQPGRSYRFVLPDASGRPREIVIRDDAAGHDYGPGDPQNRGPHFNDPANGHYDY